MNPFSELSLLSRIIYDLPSIIATVDSVSSAVSNLKGKSKEDAAVALLHDTPEIAEALQNPAIEAAIRDLIKAVVALANTTKTAAK